MSGPNSVTILAAPRDELPAVNAMTDRPTPDYGSRPNMDDDLGMMTVEQLKLEVTRLRNGIRAHRDNSRHALCWHQPELWGMLPERTDPQPIVPTWPEFLRGCLKYRQSLDDQLPDAPRSDRPYTK